MEGQSDKIESSPVLEKKTATYFGSQQADSASDEVHDVEKQGISQRPELKRKLKSRHLQMIAIGIPAHQFSLLILTISRWYNWHRSLHRKWRGHL